MHRWEGKKLQPRNKRKSIFLHEEDDICIFCWAKQFFIFFCRTPTWFFGLNTHSHIALNFNSLCRPPFNHTDWISIGSDFFSATARKTMCVCEWTTMPINFVFIFFLLLGSTMPSNSGKLMCCCWCYYKCFDSTPNTRIQTIGQLPEWYIGEVSKRAETGDSVMWRGRRRRDVKNENEAKWM